MFQTEVKSQDVVLLAAETQSELLVRAGGNPPYAEHPARAGRGGGAAETVQGMIAEWLVSLGRPEDHAEMLAHHYLQALDLSHAAGLETAELVEPARLALRDAGDRAAALWAAEAAERFYDAGAHALAGGRRRGGPCARAGLAVARRL